jgi:hypothetical protein
VFYFIVESHHGSSEERWTEKERRRAQALHWQKVQPQEQRAEEQRQEVEP